MPTPAIKEAMEVIDDRKTKLQAKFEFESGQGILPLTNEKYFEQSNPILRSALYSTTKMGKVYTDWTKIFSFGKGSIMYKGPGLTIEHEIVMARLLTLARGKSLTKPVHVYLADILRWLDLGDSGANFAKARTILDDLSTGEIKIADKIALRRLYELLTSPSVADRPDGKFYKQSIENRFGPMLKMIAQGLENDEPVDITMRFISNRAHNSITGKTLLSLDLISAVFFDGVNTTLLPFEIYDTLDRFGKKLLPFIASHRDGVFPIKLESYHKFSGSISEYAKVKRRMKSDFVKRLKTWEAKGWIEPGWTFYRNDDGEDLVRGLKLGADIRCRSELTIADLEPHRDDIDGQKEEWAPEQPRQRDAFDDPETAE
jgi:hypothetical protein